MKITTVKFGQLRSYGEFQNMTIEAEAAIEPDEAPEYALRILKGWVADQLAEAIEKPAISDIQLQLKAEREALAAIERQKWRVESEVGELQRKARKLQTLEGIAEAQSGAGSKEAEND